ncbi:DUF1772 domain-containing protein [Dongia soli]|uniref:Anthrone oxygenase family protein n=1 Tax=Dongia soli TaxID=600628 RepID=A0ABU5EHD4_9PROT|nr:anthrone oxygenase family protein [Dongia soli]MDY0884823.1 anthrone oxygenase family protein [Dongia soli]
MTGSLTFAFAFVDALGCGLVAGVFFAFSTFVMPALARLRPAQGIAAMQSINLLAVTPWFMSLLFGTALLCLASAVLALLDWRGAASAWMLAGSTLYLAGVILVTMMFNVPLNNILAAQAPESAEAAGVWTRYLAAWTRWNHLRTITPTGAAGCFILALQ